MEPNKYTHECGQKCGFTYQDSEWKDQMVKVKIVFAQYDKSLFQ